MSINIFITNWRIGELILWGGQHNQVRGIGDNGLKAQRTLSPIWFVVATLWFVDAALCISKHPTSVKNNLHFRTFSSNSLHNPNKCFTFTATVPATPLPWMRTTAGLRVFIEYIKDVHAAPNEKMWPSLSKWPHTALKKIILNKLWIKQKIIPWMDNLYYYRFSDQRC